MEQFDAPESGPGGTADVDPADAVPGWTVRLGALAFAVAGAFVAGSGFQLWVFFFMTWPVKIVATLLCLVGATAVVLAAFLAQGRAWAAWLGGVVAGTQVLLALGWVIYAFMSGLISAMAILGALFSMLAVLMVLIAIPGAVKASAARKALYSI